MHAVPLEVEADGERVRPAVRSWCWFSTARPPGGFRLARRSSIKDGLFDCLMLEKKNFLRSTLAMGRYLLGGNPKIVRHLRARRSGYPSRRLNEPTDVDGQKGAEFPLHIECIAGGLRVDVPPRGGEIKAGTKSGRGHCVFPLFFARDIAFAYRKYVTFVRNTTTIWRILSKRQRR